MEIHPYLTGRSNKYSELKAAIYLPTPWSDIWKNKHIMEHYKGIHLMEYSFPDGIEYRNEYFLSL